MSFLYEWNECFDGYDIVVIIMLVVEEVLLVFECVFEGKRDFGLNIVGVVCRFVGL